VVEAAVLRTARCEDRAAPHVTSPGNEQSSLRLLYVEAPCGRTYMGLRNRTAGKAQVVEMMTGAVASMRRLSLPLGSSSDSPPGTIFSSPRSCTVMASRIRLFSSACKPAALPPDALGMHHATRCAWHASCKVGWRIQADDMLGTEVQRRTLCHVSLYPG